MFTVEYQFIHWQGRDDSKGNWWIESETTFKSKASRTRFINSQNSKYEFITFRAKNFREEEEKIVTKEKEIEMTDNRVVIYTDGSSSYKDGLGGIGIYIKFGEHEKIISRGYSHTTNNRMELRAVIEAMKVITLKNYEVHIYSDSELVVNTFTSWIFKWEKDGYVDRKNVDLLKEGLEEYRKFPKGNVILHWVKGHNGILGNEIADMLASEGRGSGNYIRCRVDGVE